ncbi:tight adherence protein B [Pseudomonas reinekei]|jgi:tight adherence protein B|uniref:Tight adherence protein B n=1 Tax=Pseudomonas reinekei TaxID=395598 RepID=A0A1H0MP30_PSERE|nr:type II secretion system F family protein [Pseudomonas reinekei]KAB0484564.1 type II secretion system F family protein [Pseudomonas reinekei]OLU01388.1 type II secretion system protein F [Pseudomonas reinekei]SDO82213.1 tight adherence protein B [Pseudomonas reinekei]
MLKPLLLILVCLLLLGLSARLLYRGLRQPGTQRVLERLSQGQPERVVQKTSWTALERAFLRAGLGRPTERIGQWLALWGLLAVIGVLAGGWIGLLLASLLPPLLLRVFVQWRYQRRLKRMIEQLPPLLDHTVRSLKSGRTLADAVLGAINAAEDPLKNALGRVQRNVQLGISLPDATSDFAELYDKDELRLFALGLKVNHRYGGNASELLENLIKMIREREQAARQLSAMTGETRVTAVVLAAMPVALAGYFLISNPTYLLAMWNDGSGQTMLIAALGFQVIGCVALWRMLRSL